MKNLIFGNSDITCLIADKYICIPDFIHLTRVSKLFYKVLTQQSIIGKQVHTCVQVHTHGSLGLYHLDVLHAACKMGYHKLIKYLMSFKYVDEIHCMRKVLGTAISHEQAEILPTLFERFREVNKFYKICMDVYNNKNKGSYRVFYAICEEFGNVRAKSTLINAIKMNRIDDVKKIVKDGHLLFSEIKIATYYACIMDYHHLIDVIGGNKYHISHICDQNKMIR